MGDYNLGIGFITCNRPEYLKQSYGSFFPYFNTTSDKIVIVNDGTDPVDIKSCKIINNSKNLGVGRSKNKALKYLLDQGCEHIFLIEDDIIATGKSHPFQTYIEHALHTGLQHLMFGYHGPANKGGVSKGSPQPRLVVEYDNTHKIALNLHCVGAFCYYSRRCLEEVGLMDTEYNNAFEHVDHSYMIAKAGMIPNYWWWPDVANSYEFLDEIECSEASSSIRPRSDWQQNIQKGAEHFYRKHRYRPAWSDYVPDIPQRKVLEKLKEIKKEYGKD